MDESKRKKQKVHSTRLKSARDIFIQLNREREKEKNTHKNYGIIDKELKKKWAGMSIEEKQVFVVHCLAI